jgi:hypothetical protein
MLLGELLQVLVTEEHSGSSRQRQQQQQPGQAALRLLLRCSLANRLSISTFPFFFGKRWKRGSVYILAKRASPMPAGGPEPLAPSGFPISQVLLS